MMPARSSHLEIAADLPKLWRFVFEILIVRRSKVHGGETSLNDGTGSGRGVVPSPPSPRSKWRRRVRDHSETSGAAGESCFAETTVSAPTYDRCRKCPPT